MTFQIYKKAFAYIIPDHIEIGENFDFLASEDRKNEFKDFLVNHSTQRSFALMDFRNYEIASTIAYFKNLIYDRDEDISQENLNKLQNISDFLNLFKVSSQR